MMTRSEEGKRWHVPSQLLLTRPSSCSFFLHEITVDKLDKCIVYFGACVVRSSGLGRTSTLAAWLAVVWRTNHSRVIFRASWPLYGTRHHRHSGNKSWHLLFCCIQFSLWWVCVLFEITLKNKCFCKFNVWYSLVRIENIGIAVNIHSYKNRTQRIHHKLPIGLDCVLLITYELFCAENTDWR